MAKEKTLADQLCGEWLHSNEEDTESETVYRLADFDFPPTRGRSGFELQPDKTLKRIEIASRDGSQVVDGTWSIEKNDNEDSLLALVTPDSSEEFVVLNILPGKLVVRPSTQERE